MSDKQNEYYNQGAAKKKVVDRKFEEITNQDQWKKNCIDR